MLDVSNPFFGQVVQGIEDRLADEGLVLLLCSSNNSEEKELRQLRVLEEQRVLGLIIAPLSRDMAEIEALHRRRARRGLAGPSSIQAPLLLGGGGRRPWRGSSRLSFAVPGV